MLIFPVPVSVGLKWTRYFIFYIPALWGLIEGWVLWRGPLQHPPFLQVPIDFICVGLFQLIRTFQRDASRSWVIYWPSTGALLKLGSLKTWMRTLFSKPVTLSLGMLMLVGVIFGMLSLIFVAIWVQPPSFNQHLFNDIVL
jgi:hypothetical protein